MVDVQQIGSLSDGIVILLNNLKFHFRSYQITNEIKYIHINTHIIWLLNNHDKIIIKVKKRQL